MIRKIKLKKCKQCGKEFKQNNSLHVICSSPCYFKWADKTEVEKRVKQFKANVQKLSDIEAIAKTVFQKWVRKRDEHLPCISCGKESAKWDGGHFKKAEIYSGVIFNEMNVNKQCSHCNQWLNGNEGAYRIGLVERYGSLAVEGLEELANETRQYKFTKSELEEIISKYRLKLKNNN